MRRLVGWLFLAAILLTCARAQAQEPVPIDGDLASELVGHHLAFFRDPTRALGLHEVRAAYRAGRFEPSTKEANNFGYDDAAIWVRLVASNTTEQPIRWLLDMRYELHDSVDLYAADGRGGFRHQHAGDFAPMATWPIAYRAVVFPIDQPPGTMELYLRVQTTNPLNLPLTIHSPDAFAELAEHEAILLWLYYGLLIALAVYNGFLFLFLRDRSYLYYVLYILAAGAFIFSHNGLAYRYLWPDSPDWNNRAHIVFALAASLAVVQFCRSFLNTPRTLPRVDRVFVWLIVVAAGIGLPSLFVYAPFVGQLGAVLLIGVMGLMLGTGIVLLRRGFHPARFYVIGWSALLLGVSVSLLQALGLLPINFLTDWGYQIASGLETVLFSVALADRINQMKRDVEALNVALEDQVVQRTRSLRSATLNLTQRTAELERINEQLRSEIEERQRAERERNSIEEQLRQSQKMDAVGRLAGGVAHDMNNVLGVIMGYAEFLQQDLDSSDPKYEDVGEVLRAVKRGKDLTGNLLAFARRGTYHKQRLDMNELLGEVRALLERTVMRRVEIVTELAAELPGIEGDANQLTHALMNLCLNSVQAMGDSGTLTLRSRVVTVTPDLAEGDESASGVFVEVDVEDTGSGMTEEVLEQALEPFYTTGPHGERSGLGLSMAYGTLKSHGGELSLASEPGRGTIATLRLPAVDASPPLPAASPEPDPERPLVGTVLVVDDEEMMRKSMARMLGSAGLDVVDAEDGFAALEIFEERRQEIAVVVLDMMMPGMDGAQTFEALRKMDESVPVLLSSGFADQAAAQRLLASGAAGLLSKPFRLKELVEAVRQAMARRG